ncbi:MAG: hypothetical protein MUF81_08955, partial [Verrucomicrobia bacterium]|nr:hypothetical protein [Verrucomicrobiota bacterium]
KGFAGKYSPKAGDVHYTTAGYEQLADQVAATMEKVLPHKTSRSAGASGPLGNSVIPREDFKKWSRWYQEDGRTQVFRLFKGETNVRNTRANAARIEAFSNVSWKRGAWHEWSGTYTIIKPHGAAIFQAKNNIHDWSVQINMNATGDVILNHRRAEDKVIATDMVGKPFHIRVRDNGQDYEVYLEGQKVGEGSYARPEGTTGFRWGMYVGHSEVDHDAMIFVSGATVDAETASDAWNPPSPASAKIEEVNKR